MWCGAIVKCSMPSVRDILNELKWKKADMSKLQICFIHRGAPDDMKCIWGDEIVSVDRAYFCLKKATIPYHRVLTVIYEEEVLFDRKKL